MQKLFWSTTGQNGVGGDHKSCAVHYAQYKKDGYRMNVKNPTLDVMRFLSSYQQRVEVKCRKTFMTR